ncbi:hypothetical protein [Pseudactinotalea sp. Z1732]|uniref:hypothetical protein n=1 Tax=Micrococcales TaxID=85006 RepID=UPI003C7CD283
MSRDLIHATLSAVIGVVTSASGFYSGSTLQAWAGGVFVGLSFAWVGVWAATRADS